MAIRAVLFDIDGTLLDHDAASRSALRSRIRTLEGRPDPADAARAWLELEELHYNAYLEGQFDLAEQRRRRARDFVSRFDGVELDDEAATAWYDAYLDGYRAAWKLFDDVEPLLALLATSSSIAVGAITNADAHYQRGKLQAVGLDQLLANFTASSEAGAAKPDRRIFIRACTSLGLEPSEVAYVGDRPDVDAAGAAGAGLQAIWLDRPGNPFGATVAQSPSFTRITSLSEIPTLLNL